MLTYNAWHYTIASFCKCVYLNDVYLAKFWLDVGSNFIYKMLFFNTTQDRLSSPKKTEMDLTYIWSHTLQNAALFFITTWITLTNWLRIYLRKTFNLNEFYQYCNLLNNRRGFESAYVILLFLT